SPLSRPARAGPPRMQKVRKTKMKCCRTNWMRRNPQGPTWQQTTVQQQAFAWRFLEMGLAHVGKQLGTIASHRPEFSYYRGGGYDESRSTGNIRSGRSIPNS